MHKATVCLIVISTLVGCASNSDVSIPLKTVTVEPVKEIDGVKIQYEPAQVKKTKPLTTSATPVTLANTQAKRVEQNSLNQATRINTNTASSKAGEQADPSDTASTDLIKRQFEEEQKLLASVRKPEFPYLELRAAKSDSHYIRDGVIYFKVHKAKGLIGNLQSLFALSREASLDFAGISPNHTFPSDVWVSGPSLLHIADQLITPFKAPYPIRGVASPNNIVSFYYEGSR